MATSANFDRLNSTWKNQRIASRILEIDGLRGLAILLVLFFHYVTAIGAPRHRFWEIVTSSTHLFWSGVDLFFVLSGFLISGILLDSARSPQYFTTFYMRRFHRIFPLYFGWLAIFYLGTYVSGNNTLVGQLFRGGIPLWFYPLFIQNNAPLWLNAAAPLWMGMSWSLAVEEQFYIVLPSLVRFLNKTALVWLCGATILFSPLYRFLLVAANPNIDAGWPFATLSRLDGLAMGVALALLMRNRNCWTWMNQHPSAVRVFGMSLSLSFVALTYSFPDQLSMAAYGFTIISVFYSALLLIAVCQPSFWLSSALRLPILRYFGKISFAIYIFHQGVHGLLDKLLPTWGARLNAVRVASVVILALSVTVMLAELSWRLMESKLIRRAHLRYRYRND